MTTYLNLMPIRFGSQGVVFDRVSTNVGGQQAGCFSHGGMHYALPGKKLNETTTPVAIDPIDIPEVMLPYLRGRLADLLRQHGSVEAAGDGLAFQLANGRIACHLAITRGYQPDPSKGFRYAIQVNTPAPADEGYFKVWNDMGILQDQPLLPDGDGQIGPFELLQQPPLQARSLIFSIDGTQHDHVAKAGLLRFGPYSKAHMRRRILRIAYLDLASQNGDIGHFLQNLQQGVQHPERAKNIWGRSWAEAFCFADVVFTPIATEKAECIESLDFVLLGLKAEGAGVDVVVYFDDQIDARLEADLLTLGIPPHRVPRQALEWQDVPRADLLLDTALALYAKCQGEPWLLTQDPQLVHEVVVGIGSHVIGGRELGYATVFTSQGNYRLGEAGWMPPGVEWQDYFSMLLIGKLLELERENQWERYTSVHLLLHLDRHVEPERLTALKARLWDRFGDRAKLQVSFLHLTEAHDYLLWGGSKDTPVPRGAYVELSPRTALLQLAETDGAAAKPLLLELLEPSDNPDLRFKLRQVYYFSHMAWTGVRPARLPVTLLYSQLVAAKFAAYSAVKPDLRLPTSLHTLPWYL